MNVMPHFEHHQQTLFMLVFWVVLVILFSLVMSALIGATGFLLLVVVGLCVAWQFVRRGLL